MVYCRRSFIIYICVCTMYTLGSLEASEQELVAHFIFFALFSIFNFTWTVFNIMQEKSIKIEIFFWP